MPHYFRLAGPLLALSALPALSQDVDGAAVYEETCAGCHGDDSELSASAMAGLGQAAFAESLAEHPEVGGAIADLSEDDISALHAYVSQQGG